MNVIDRTDVNREYQAGEIRREAERQSAASKSTVLGYVSSRSGLLAFVLLIGAVGLIYLLGS